MPSPGPSATALHIAVVLGLPGAVWKLRAAGAGVTVRERGGHTPLHLACREGHPACAHALLGELPDPRNARQDSQKEEEEERQAQLESQTALHVAVVLGLAGAVRRLRAAGAGVAVRERGGHTPLHLACREGHPACAHALLGEPREPRDARQDSRKEEEERQAQLESVNYDGYTPLHVAVLRRDPELVQLLLRAGADPDRPEPSCGRTPLHLASKKNPEPSCGRAPCI
ncbi:NF-kappa-B inhibitor beta-like [Malurus melanocephalus]|uniref:NF-kappa-B inhibitor beta-like n=1 Tax=Malurus melanocephalus TaxID=175006 RepID=UPI0025482C7A|nr:NF-kappa-B inhibitor beta-like [Malurus melanocephalus]